MPLPRWRQALVTGASSGIGEAIARRLAAEGSELVLVARRRDRLQRLGEELRGPSSDVEVISADLTTAAGLEQVEARLASADRPVDLLVNNAGGGRLSVFPDGTPEDEESGARLNAISVLRLTAAALPGMRGRKRGTILNISAGAAFQPSPHAAVYGASKAFVNSFSQAIGEENRRHGIVVTVVCPGFTETDLPVRAGFDVARVPRFLWMSADEVARRALDAAAKGKAVYVPGLANKLGALLGRFAPRAVVLPFVARGTANLWKREPTPS